MGEERQEGEQIEHHRERLLPVPGVVFEFVAVIFLHVKLLILNLPARAPHAGNRRDGLVGHDEISDPRIVRADRAIGTLFPDFQEVDLHYS